MEKKKAIISTKHFLLVVLCLYAAIALLPGKAAAAGIVDHGTCGNSLTWTLDNEGTLTIEGTGNMWFSDSTSRPWESHLSDIKHVDICAGVTSIAERAFYKCVEMTDITIPDSVTYIEWGAFGSCKKLTAIQIPNSVTYIGSGAFNLCTSLTQIKIPDGVTRIYSSTFSYSDNLTTIDIPDSVTYIDEYAFQGCDKLANIQIPNGVTYIAKGAFRSCEGLTEITIPEGITKIEDETFLGCKNLTSIDFQGNKPYMGENMFKNVTATAYYPCGNDTWIEDALEEYGGTITWEKLHTYGDWAVASQSTYVTAGVERRICEVCGQTEERSIAPTGPAVVSGIETDYDVNTRTVKFDGVPDDMTVVLGAYDGGQMVFTNFKTSVVGAQLSFQLPSGISADSVRAFFLTTDWRPVAPAKVIL